MKPGVTILCEPDTAAPHLGVVFQQRVILAPTTRPARRLLLAYAHGSGGGAGTANATQPANAPGYLNDATPYNHAFYRAFAERGWPVVVHDLFGINPATGAIDPQQFGSKAVMDIFDLIRTNVAPRIGCRTDKIVVGGESQGSLDALMYVLEKPSAVAACVLTLPGADVEADRAGGPFQPNINQNWGFPSPYNQSVLPNSWALGVGGPRLTARGTYTPGVTYNVNDFVNDPNAVNQYGSAWWRRYPNGGKAVAANASIDANWQALDPMALHLMPPTEGGNALAFQAGIAGLSGKTASVFEPANVTRMADIIAGRITGTRVPIYVFYSAGDSISNEQGIYGVLDHFKWYAGQVGIVLTELPPAFNHTGNPQQADPQYTQSVTLSSGQSMVFTPGANSEVVVKVSGTWTGSLLVQVSTNGTTWTTIPGVGGGPYARSTVGTRASSVGWTPGAGGATEGPAVTTLAGNGYWRINAKGYINARILKSGGTGTATIVGGNAYPGDIQQSAVDHDWLCAQLAEHAA